MLSGRLVGTKLVVDRVYGLDAHSASSGSSAVVIHGRDSPSWVGVVARGVLEKDIVTGGVGTRDGSALGVWLLDDTRMSTIAGLIALVGI